MQDMDLNRLVDLIDTCTQYAYTNINPATFLSLARTLFASGLAKRTDSEEALFEQMHIPQPGKYQYGTVNGNSVLTLNIPTQMTDITKLTPWMSTRWTRRSTWRSRR